MSKFLKDLLERAGSTAAEAALAVMAVTGFDLFNVMDLKHAGAVAIAAGVLAIMKALAAKKVGDKDSASLVDLEK